MSERFLVSQFRPIRFIFPRQGDTHDRSQQADNARGQFPGALLQWAERLHPSEYDHDTFDRAFRAIDNALLKTAAYLSVRRLPPDTATEQTLSELWMTASRAVSPIDPDFADAMAHKGLGWANPRFWHVAEGLGYKIEVIDVQKAREVLTKKRHQLERTRATTPAQFAPPHITAGNPVLIVALVFAGVLV